MEVTAATTWPNQTKLFIESDRSHLEGGGKLRESDGYLPRASYRQPALGPSRTVRPGYPRVRPRAALRKIDQSALQGGNLISETGTHTDDGL